MTSGFTELAREEQQLHEVTFEGINQNGELIVGSTLRTSEVGLVPTEPLTLTPYEEALTRLDLYGWHGELEHTFEREAQLTKTRSGSWSFYWAADGRRHAPWDNSSAQGCSGSERIGEEYGQGIFYQTWPEKAEENYPGETHRPWAFCAEMRKLLCMIQGRRVRVTMPDGEQATGRCWVTELTTDDTGQERVTIKYELN